MGADQRKLSDKLPGSRVSADIVSKNITILKESGNIHLIKRSGGGSVPHVSQLAVETKAENKLQTRFKETRIVVSLYHLDSGDNQSFSHRYLQYDLLESSNLTSVGVYFAAHTGLNVRRK